ncbi:MAG TPA: class I SAM-dependent methyltransferase [Blastocatellia bacterium]|nr:class I SAM-dependent methyltransferase [Blastocatellia bacterium]
MHESEYRAMFELEDRLWWYTGMRAITATLLGRVGQIDTVLDVGCGTGYSMNWLKHTFEPRQVFGVDLSKHAAALWKEGSIDSAVIASAELLPFEAGRFDLVTCFDVVYQLDSQGVEAALGEINRVLKPGGLLFIREPAYDWLRGSHDVIVATHQRFTLSRLRRVLMARGFAPRRMTYANTLLFPLAVAHRLASGMKKDGGSDVKEVAPAINRVFAGVLGLEARLLRVFRFPFGLSTVAVAEKR